MASHQGISFTEFTYQLLQAYDFYYLHKNAGCTIQIGGSDQWGNIVAGIDLINRISASESGENPEAEEKGVEKAYGITTLLLTTSSGAKFGKSAGNAVALDQTITSVFDFYQVRTLDLLACRFLFSELTIMHLKVLPQDHRCRS